MSTPYLKRKSRAKVKDMLDWGNRNDVEKPWAKESREEALVKSHIFISTEILGVENRCINNR